MLTKSDMRERFDVFSSVVGEKTNPTYLEYLDLAARPILPASSRNMLLTWMMWQLTMNDYVNMIYLSPSQSLRKDSREIARSICNKIDQSILPKIEVDNQECISFGNCSRLLFRCFSEYGARGMSVRYCVVDCPNIFSKRYKDFVYYSSPSVLRQGKIITLV